jgi:uncharacterized membrane protein
MSTTPEKKGWRWGRFLLIVSLALNLLIVGAMVGSRLMPPHERHGPPGEFPEHFIGRALQGLPEDKRDSIVKLVKSDWESAQQKFVLMRQLREQLKKAINADPLKPEELRETIMKLVTLRRDLDAGRSEVLVAVLSKLNAEERRQLLKSRFFRRLMGPGKPRGEKGHRPPPPM